MRIRVAFFFALGLLASSASAQTQLSCHCPLTEFRIAATNRVMVGEYGFDTTLVPRTRWRTKDSRATVTRHYTGSLWSQFYGYFFDQTVDGWDENISQAQSPLSTVCNGNIVRQEWQNNCDDHWSVCNYFPTCSARPVTPALANGFDIYWPAYSEVIDSINIDNHYYLEEGYDIGDWDENQKTEVILGNQYTQGEFLGDLRGDLAQVISEINSLDPEDSEALWSEAPSVAQFQYTDSIHNAGVDQALQFRFKITTDLKIPYRITWDEVYEATGPNGAKIVEGLFCGICRGAGFL